MIKTFYSIVPVNDGYHYVCKNANNEHILIHKEEDPPIGGSLVFNTEDMANDYIIKNLNADEFKSEPLWVITSDYNFEVGM